MNYINKVFGNRKIIKNECVDSDWYRIGMNPPKNKRKYKLSICMNCGIVIPSEISNIKRNKPYRCSFCSNINYTGIFSNKSNIYYTVGFNVIIKIRYKDKYILTTIDKADIEIVKLFNWRVSKKRNKSYISTSFKNKTIYLHKYLMSEELSPDEYYEIDHINGNSLCRTNKGTYG